jgi:hypothetical protein
VAGAEAGGGTGCQPDATLDDGDGACGDGALAGEAGGAALPPEAFMNEVKTPGVEAESETPGEENPLALTGDGMGDGVAGAEAAGGGVEKN